jgi:hypothetical protein
MSERRAHKVSRKIKQNRREEEVVHVLLDVSNGNKHFKGEMLMEYREEL